MRVEDRQDAGRPGTAGPACIMVGPGPGAQGGVASVVQVYEGAGLFSAGRVLAINSFSTGSGLDKLWVAVSAFMRYLTYLVRGQAPVLHVHVSSHASFWRKAAFIWAAVVARRKVVFHLHGGGFQAFVESRGPLARAVIRSTLRRSDRVLCLSTPVAAWLTDLLPGLPVQWWPNPVPADLFEPSEATEPREPIVLFLGALLPAKGVPDLLQAFAQLHAAHPEARLVLAGDGPERRALHVQAEVLADRVTFLGWVGPEARRHWLRRARLLVLPSHLEAQPMVLLEAMAAGLPVVSTDVGGVPDIVSTGQQGVLVPARKPGALATALLALWQDESQRMRLAAHARERTESRHRADVVCDGLLALYDELADERR